MLLALEHLFIYFISFNLILMLLYYPQVYEPEGLGDCSPLTRAKALFFGQKPAA